LIHFYKRFQKFQTPTAMAMFGVGDRVERNPAEWYILAERGGDHDHDGGAGKQGTVQNVVKASKQKEKWMVQVKWDHTGNLISYFQRRLKLVKTMDLKADAKEVESFEFYEMKKRNIEIYEKMIYTDFVIISKTDGSRFPCHKAILAAGSAHFARMFESGMTESSSGQVEIEGYKNEIVEAFIKFLYLPAVDKEILKINAESLLKMADQYDVPKLKEVVVKTMLASMSKENVLETILAAHRYNAPNLKEDAIQFIVKHRVDKGKLAEWKVKMKGEEELLFDIFSAIM